MTAVGSTRLEVDRHAIRADLRQHQVEFHALLDATTAKDLKAPTKGTRWNNEELLFHMLLGYIVVTILTGMVTALGRLPRAATRPLATLLDALTPAFDALNYLAARVGARIFNHRRMGPKFDRIGETLLSKLDRASEADLRRGMYLPRRWDPFFEEYMTLADIFRYPSQHFDFHRKQLTVHAPR